MTGASIPPAIAWPPIPGAFQVVTYDADFSRRPWPPDYSRNASYSHRTLKAAARRLARMLSGRGGRPLADGADVAYILTPDGERLPLRAAQARIAGHA